MRVKCATLAWHTLTSAVNNDQVDLNIEKLWF
jgi:NifU-like protein involved in Fe-S cluster formation